MWDDVYGTISGTAGDQSYSFTFGDHPDTKLALYVALAFILGMIVSARLRG